MAPRPVIEKRKEEYAQLLEKCSMFFVAMKKSVVAERFSSYARMVREANSLRRVRKVCAKVRGEFVGTTGGTREGYINGPDGNFDREATHAYDVTLDEVRNYSSPFRWLI